MLVRSPEGESALTMDKDPIVDEVHRIKEARAKRYNYDIRAMVRALRANQRKNRGRLVTLSPKRPATASKISVTDAR
jgi:hypothetical protein